MLAAVELFAIVKDGDGNWQEPQCQHVLGGHLHMAMAL